MCYELLIRINPLDFTGSSNAGTNQVDLFGQSLVGDLMDAAPSFSPQATVDNNSVNSEVDLFADATFQSASHADAISDSHTQVVFLHFGCLIWNHSISKIFSFCLSASYGDLNFRKLFY